MGLRRGYISRQCGSEVIITNDITNNNINIDTDNINYNGIELNDNNADTYPIKEYRDKFRAVLRARAQSAVIAIIKLPSLPSATP